MLINNHDMTASCKFNEHNIEYVGCFVISYDPDDCTLVAYKGWKFVFPPHNMITSVYVPANVISLSKSNYIYGDTIVAFSRFNKFIKIPATLTLNINYICGMRRDVFVEGLSILSHIDFTKLSKYLHHYA